MDSGGDRGQPAAATDRGIAIGLVVFVTMIVVAGLLYTLFDPALTDLFDMTSSQADTTKATDQINLAEQIWGAVLFYALFVSVLFLIARSVFESRRPG